VMFWIKSWSAVGLMLFFIIFALFDFPHIIDTAIRQVQDFSWFRSERRRKATLGPLHIMLKILQAFKLAVYIFVQLTATVLIAPVTLAVSQAVDCREYEGKHGKYLEKFPAIQCYVGEHNELRWMMLPTFVVFIIFLIPYACCAGDASYVPHSTLFDLRFWREDGMWQTAARRKATDLNLGFLHPMPVFAFRTLFVDLLVKVALPIITTETHGLLQMIMITAVGTFQMVDVFRCRPFLEEKFSALVQCMKMVTVSAMSTGLFTVYLNNPESLVPTAMLGILLIILFGYLAYRMSTIPMRRPTVRVYNAESEPSPGKLASEGSNVEG